MTKDEVIDLLEKCQSSEDWRIACRIIKEEHENGYPDFWWKEVILSGVGDRIAARWGSDMQLHVRIIDFPGVSPEKGDSHDPH